MMKNNLFQRRLMEEINKKIPQKTKVVNYLSDLLDIEKEAVYRRLRAEVPFTFNEVAAISKNLQVSVDDIIDMSTEDISSFKLKAIKFLNPEDQDYPLMEQLAKFLNFINHPGTEAVEASSTIPQVIYFNYECLTRFFLFKWFYCDNSSSHSIPYEEVEISPVMKEYYQLTSEASHKMGYTKYIFDFDIFRYFCNDITYFRSINLIKEESIELIKKELLSLIDYIERLTLTGRFEDTGNRVQVYISNLNFPTSYSYIKTETYHISFVKAFAMNAIVSFDMSTFENIKNWIQSITKSATLITESGEIDRIKFFGKQRELIMAL